VSGAVPGFEPDFAAASKVADAVLFEGYLLYPYRASAAKNQLRWQFGVLVPPAWSEADPSEHSASQTECLLEAPPGAQPDLRLRVRFLQLRTRTASGRPPWDEGVVREVDSAARLEPGERVVPFEVPGGQQDGLRWWPLSGRVRLQAERLEGPYGLVKLRLRVENTGSWADANATRPQALRRSLVTCHLLLALRDASFVSLLDPPEWAAAAAASCENRHTWPVLVGAAGRRDQLLSSPIILYDHPEVAPESPGDLFDATEIDEILMLRTMALTEAEKREARATDERSAAIIDRVDSMPPELLERLHGAVRQRRRADPPDPAQVPWWDPGADASVSPETDSVPVGGVAVAKGSRVRLRPGARRADAQDLFLAGRSATVEAVFLDVDGDHHLAVTLDDDPAAELQRWHGRYLYFAPDEVEPL
jgi:hypothetical protein